MMVRHLMMHALGPRDYKYDYDYDHEHEHEHDNAAFGIVSMLPTGSVSMSPRTLCPCPLLMLLDLPCTFPYNILTHFYTSFVA